MPYPTASFLTVFQSSKVQISPRSSLIYKWDRILQSLYKQSHGGDLDGIQVREDGPHVKVHTYQTPAQTLGDITTGDFSVYSMKYPQSIIQDSFAKS
jgi:hypothetical protein